MCEVCGKAKHGAAYCWAITRSVRSDTGEVLHSRKRGNVHFARETLTVRADAGFFSYDMIAALGAHGASYSILPHYAKVKAAQDDDAWVPIDTRGARAQVADHHRTTSCAAPAASGPSCGHRAPHLGAQGELWPNWRHHCDADTTSHLCIPPSSNSPSET